MPLDKSGTKASVSRNISTLRHEGKPQDQAIAIAMDVARRAKRAAGGGTMPGTARDMMKGMMHTGPINSAVPGRTDRHNMRVPAGSYVIPAETISHLGQSNTAAGMKVVQSMFGSPGPYGVKAMPIRRSLGVRKKAEGGAIGEPVPVVTAGGEYVIDPEVVTAIGDGDIDRGHQVLDQWIMTMRKDHIKTLRSLSPPAKD